MKKTTFFTLARRYRFLLIMLGVNLLLLVFRPQIGLQSFRHTGQNLLSMLAVLPPIFILLGLLDTWVKRETMVKYMGEESRLTGLVIGFFMGSAAAGPLYASFPIAEMLIRKGSRLYNVFVFMGAWTTTKVTLLLFEISSMGLRFSLTRLAVNLFGILSMAGLMDRLLSPEDKEALRLLAQQQE